MDTENEVRASFGKIWPVHVGSLTRFLIDCRRHFDGDLDMMLVLAIIGDRTFSLRKSDPNMDFNMFMASEASSCPEDINARSIADFSGIPRETVRRKVMQLVDKGWIERRSGGPLVATLKCKQELEPLTLISIKYLAGMMKVIDDCRVNESRSS